jgi:acyl-CoA hydrolase
MSILVGQIVTLTAQIVHTGKTSMHIYIRIVAGDPKQDKMVETGHCIMAFVASNEAGYTGSLSKIRTPSFMTIFPDQTEP